MITSGYCPARFGVLAELTPRAPWHIVHFSSASEPPRPADSLLPMRISGRRTTLVPGLPATTSPLPHEPGTPAARQIASHSPLAVKSEWAEGSQTNPISIETIVTATRAMTLLRITGLPFGPRAPTFP